MRVSINRQLLGVEDLLVGEGTVPQTRGGQQITITKLNAASLPWGDGSGLTYKAALVAQIAIATAKANTATIQAELATTNGAIQVALATEQAVISTEQAVISTAQAVISSNSAASALNSKNEAMESAIICAAAINLAWYGFEVINGELVVYYNDLGISTPSIVDGDFIVTY